MGACWLQGKQGKVNGPQEEEGKLKECHEWQIGITKNLKWAKKGKVTRDIHTGGEG